MRLREYLSAERGRQSLLCKQLCVHASDLSMWSTGKRPVPPHNCPAIEQATARSVMRWDLRPDDWWRIWPELIGTEGAPAVPAPAAQQEARDAA